MHRLYCDNLTQTVFFSSRQVDVKSLMKTLTLHMTIVIKPSQCRFDRTNKYLERMLLFLNSVYGRGLKHAERGSHLTREVIFCGPRYVLGIWK